VPRKVRRPPISEGACPAQVSKSCQPNISFTNGSSRVACACQCRHLPAVGIVVFEAGARLRGPSPRGSWALIRKDARLVLMVDGWGMLATRPGFLTDRPTEQRTAVVTEHLPRAWTIIETSCEPHHTCSSQVIIPPFQLEPIRQHMDQQRSLPGSEKPAEDRQGDGRQGDWRQPRGPNIWRRHRLTFSQHLLGSETSARVGNRASFGWLTIRSPSSAQHHPHNPRSQPTIWRVTPSTGLSTSRFSPPCRSTFQLPFAEPH
jgi:hypothetical protein